ncbi:hypothetical protein GPY51_21275 [Photorhabdus laumondii subsp. laumondii]|uniref:Uncharacterized protein n=1 Tax=Photorhabdus laumondii subsp. laumondii TaxID=141679 RepID=A0A6L9JR51_PHOLM|nr:hypothetical protein [Photorhabdus laumondii]MCC8413646.1 hypothetical protein [Photorhabdus laumondii]NDK96864.1 hypothetical protein [Photorhabdus laumondii subsp. laumondii]NDL23060.1 hypothetical protein [Photorhabdus laumondii subsp. laumondii]NDL31982.1 hypothetical protein [Photorhabdus laumondii subsp. laumondii]NDL36605.1 hypothetical protein [Photorhabdus laumondii subsp. laumondii]
MSEQSKIRVPTGTKQRLIMGLKRHFRRGLIVTLMMGGMLLVAAVGLAIGHVQCYCLFHVAALAIPIAVNTESGSETDCTHFAGICGVL